MQRLCAMSAIVFASFLGRPSLSIAQDDLTDGRWSGTMTQPNAESELAVEYLVTHADGELAITIVTPMGRFQFADISLDGGALVFTWQPGPMIDCRLQPLDGGGYRGDCVDESGATGQLSMAPPARLE